MILKLCILNTQDLVIFYAPMRRTIYNCSKSNQLENIVHTDSKMLVEIPQDYILVYTGDTKYTG